MDFEINIQGLGNLDKLKLNIKPLTIIAGENSTGKSFATKSIYSVLDALNKNYVFDALVRNANHFVKLIVRFENQLKGNIANVDKEFVEYVSYNFSTQFNFIKETYRNANLSEQGNVKSLLESEVVSFKEILIYIDEYLKKRNKIQKIKKIEYILVDAKVVLANIIESINHHQPLVVQGIKEQLSDNFKNNFQVTKLESLINCKTDGRSGIDIESIGSLTMNADDKISFSFVTDGIVEVQKLDNIVFIDSPVYLKIRKGIEKNGLSLFASRSDRYLKGYPKYIDELYSFVDQQFLDEPDFKSVSDELQNTLSGKLAVTKSGDINYISADGVATPLSLTAMGVSNLGLIDLLIRNNIIKKGSFLIIDEPEAHIHPKWQVVLMELLYKMAQLGANVIIATHSMDMIKKLELITKEDPQAEDIISVHKLPTSNCSSDASLQDKISEVLEDLSTPFYDMYIEGMNL